MIKQAETTIIEETIRQKLLTHPIGKKLLAIGAMVACIQVSIEDEHYR